MTLPTENQMHLKYLLFVSVHKCNGLNDTYSFYALHVTLILYSQFHLLLLVTATGTKRTFMWQELLNSA